MQNTNTNEFSRHQEYRGHINR